MFTRLYVSLIPTQSEFTWRSEFCNRAPDQPGSIQFSNFSLFENRETRELELYLTPIGCDPKDWRNADCYKYKLTLIDK